MLTRSSHLPQVTARGDDDDIDCGDDDEEDYEDDDDDDDEDDENDGFHCTIVT